MTSYITYDIVNVERQVNVEDSSTNINNKIRFELRLTNPNTVISLAKEYVVCSQEKEHEFVKKEKFPISPFMHVVCAENINSEEFPNRIGSCGLHGGNELEHEVYFKVGAYNQLLADLNNGNYPSSVTFGFSENLLIQPSYQFITLNGKQAERISISSMFFSVPYLKKDKVIIDEIFSLLLNTNLVNRLTLILLVVIALLQTLNLFI